MREEWEREVPQWYSPNKPTPVGRDGYLYRQNKPFLVAMQSPQPGTWGKIPMYTRNQATDINSIHTLFRAIQEQL